MTSFDDQLRTELDRIRRTGLHRQLRRVDSPQGVRIRVDGRELLGFSSNDYLGLAAHPALREATLQAVQRHGVGSGASRLICGSLAPHHELEERLAAFKQTEAALTFSSGYATVLGTIGALVGSGDIIILDKRVHACAVDAARLSRATLRVFRHNDLDDLERILKWAVRQPRSTHHATRILIVTETVFSMDGDLAPVKALVELKERYGAWLMLDEAHATGVFGRDGRGLAQAAGVADRVEIQMGTLGKALGASGGYVCGSRALVDFLVNRARTFVFSTAPPPAAAAAANAALQIAQSAEGDARREQLWKLVPRLSALIAGTTIHRSSVGQSPILPWIVGDEQEAVNSSVALLEAGIFVPAIRYPTVARGQARLRFTLTSDHSDHELDQLGQALRTVTGPA